MRIWVLELQHGRIFPALQTGSGRVTDRRTVGMQDRSGIAPNLAFLRALYIHFPWRPS